MDRLKVYQRPWLDEHLVYGSIGYNLNWINQSVLENRILPAWLMIWAVPLQRFSLGFSWVVLSLTAWLDVDLLG